MILNPYYFIFFRIYKWLKKIGVIEEGILFSAYAVLFLIFIPHLIILLIILRHKGIILGIDLGVSKHLFGVLFAISYWLINHLLFGWRKRYVKIVKNYENTSKALRICNLVLLMIYFSIPFILMAA